MSSDPIDRSSARNNKVLAFYLVLLSLHVAHVFEEAWGQFFLLQYFGLGWYLFLNWLLFCIPVIVFYFVLRRRKWAYRLSIVYAGFMILNGLGHAVATTVTGRYYHGFAGGVSGIGLVVAGGMLIYYLRTDTPS